MRWGGGPQTGARSELAHNAYKILKVSTYERRERDVAGYAGQGGLDGDWAGGTPGRCEGISTVPVARPAANASRGAGITVSPLWHIMSTLSGLEMLT